MRSVRLLGRLRQNAGSISQREARLKARVNTQVMELCVVFTSILGCIYRKRVCGKIDFKIRIQKESGDDTAPGIFSAQTQALKIGSKLSLLSDLDS